MKINFNWYLECPSYNSAYSRQQRKMVTNLLWNQSRKKKNQICFSINLCSIPASDMLFFCYYHYYYLNMYVKCIYWIYKIMKL